MQGPGPLLTEVQGPQQVVVVMCPQGLPELIYWAMRVSHVECNGATNDCST